MNSSPTILQRRFITFEGIDGAGKSSHLQVLADWLQQKGQSVLITREPGGTPLAETLRDLLLAQPMHTDTEALLMFAARNEHLHRVILPALAQGSWVLCDRFTDSTLAYQGGGKGADLSRLRILARWVHAEVSAGRTYLFDVEAEVAARRRARQRNTIDKNLIDKFEQEDQAFFQRVIQTYRNLAQMEPGRYKVLNSTQTIDEVRMKLLEDFSAYASAYLN